MEMCLGVVSHISLSDGAMHPLPKNSVMNHWEEETKGILEVKKRISLCNSQIIRDHSKIGTNWLLTRDAMHLCSRRYR